MLNTCSVMGRLGSDPQIRETQKGNKALSFSLAVSRDYSDAEGVYGTDWVDCVAWGKSAEYLASHAKKGDLIAVTGRLQKRTYLAKDGSKRYVTEVVVQRSYLTSFKKNAEEPTFTPVPSDPEPTNEPTPWDEPSGFVS